MSNDGTGLRELAAKWRADADKCDAADDYERGMADASRIDAAQLESALSAVAPPPALEGMEDAVAAVAGAIWFAAGDEGYLMGSGPFLNAHPDDQAAMKRIASAAIKESLTVAMLAASPAAPAQPEGGDFLDDVCWQSWRDAAKAAQAELDEVAAALPGVAFMDPPDGGSPSIAEQVRRMADALREAEDRLTRPAPAQQAVTDGVEVVRIERSANLDPITVYLADEGGGRGRMTIVCYNQAWTCYWGAMGNRTLREFVARCDASYVSGNMLSGLVSEDSDFAYARRVAEAIIAALASNAAASAADAQEQPR